MTDNDAADMRTPSRSLAMREDLMKRAVEDEGPDEARAARRAP
jgi:hypothetical protein